MRFFILSDIHGNINAFKECMKYVENNNIDALIFCGDYITDFPKSHEVIKLIQFYANKYKSYIIKGNREDYIIDLEKGKKYCTRQQKTLEYTYETLTKEDIKWIESLPNTIEINLDNNKMIYVSHKCTYEKIDKCGYKIFGHSHIQSNFEKDGIKYINPGSVGLPTDGKVGAQFTILEVSDNYEKIEPHLVQYNINETLQELKNTSIYNDEIKWGRLIEKCAKTGTDYLLICFEEYDKIRTEQHIIEESLEAWKMAVEKVLK